ncbi:MAG: hypothetical protein DCC49_11520 [Acidobacteria bacterium]|nr:MAG: hypothetical protein DCC49_11520 [Acidobacteriota bacterium]
MPSPSTIDEARQGFAVKVSQLRKAFDGVVAVDGINFDVADGESVALLGANGAGKTTTILMLLGVTTADSGKIEVLGRPMPAKREEVLSQTGFAAGYITLPDRLKVREALRVFADLYGVASPRARVGEVLELFGIEHLANRSTSTLSSGQRTLASLAKALLPEPRLLILDEPTASLDPDIAKQTREQLLALKRDLGFALLVTSHNMDEVELLADRVVFMSRGQIVADASPGELAESFGSDGLEGVFLQIAERARQS